MQTNDQVTIDSAHGNKEIRCCCQMCNNHTERCSCERIQSERNVEEPEWYDPCHS